jgi:hypothetical protein
MGFLIARFRPIENILSKSIAKVYPKLSGANST